MKQRNRSDDFILFIIKRREDPTLGYATTLTSGVRSSVSFVVDMLNANGVPAAIEEVVDNNSIDALVTKYKPSVCIIEALWVVPSKFDELAALHPTVTWIIRCHSEVPFLACEGIAIEWLIAYANKPNVVIAANTVSAQADITAMIRAAYPAMPTAALKARVAYLPNYFPTAYTKPPPKPSPERVVNIGCFGAVRLLKNHLIQAVAALALSETIKLPVHFHINAGRVEGQGGPVLKSLRALFASTPYGMLVEHDWLDRAAFLALLQTMDISAQVSMTETFNIVTADAVACGIPVVVSSEIDWLDPAFYADPTSSSDILAHFVKAYGAGPAIIAQQQRCLTAFSASSAQAWLAQLL